jgi:uncharacterized membrane protein YhaH (DUF805 family)
MCCRAAPNRASATVGVVLPDMFFSFRGRLNRQPYWLRTLALIGIMLLGVMVAFALLGVGFAELQGGFPSLAGLGIVAIVMGVLYVILVVASLSLAVRRLHDRNKPGWWVLVFFVLPSVLQGMGGQTGDAATVLQLAASAISIWALVELGFLRGTAGPNRFGPDPLEAGRPS